MDDLKQMKEEMSTSEVKHEAIQQQVFLLIILYLKILKLCILKKIFSMKYQIFTLFYKRAFMCVSFRHYRRSKS